MRSRRFLVALLLAGVPSATVERGATQHAPLIEAAPARDVARAQAVLDGLVESGVPGASAACVLPGGDLLALAAGEAATGVGLTPANRFLSGSAGKTYVTAVAHRLVAEGRLAWDEPVAERFDGAEWVERLPNADVVTLRQLLRHTTGIPRYVFVPEFWRELTAEPDRVWKPEELLSFVFDEPALFAPDEGWAYADTNYIVVGMLIERVTGETFYGYVQRELLEPNELRDTVPTSRRRIERLADGHAVVGQRMGIPAAASSDGELAYNVQFEWCGGGWASTPGDLARWIGLLFSGKALEGDYLATLLETVEAAPLGEGVEYGLGAMVRETPLGKLVYHDGFMPGFLTSAGYFPERDVAVALQLNSDDARRLGRAPSDVLVELARAVVGE